MIRRSLVALVPLLVIACAGGGAAPVGASSLLGDDAGARELEDAAPLLEDAAPRDAEALLDSAVSDDPFLVTSTSVGLFRIGMRVKEARAVKKFRVAEAVEVIDGEREKVLKAFDGDTPLVEFATKGAKISAMTILEKRFRTKEGIGVGSKASLLEPAYGPPTNQYTLARETCFFFKNEQHLQICFPAGQKTLAAYAKKGAHVSSLVVGE